MYYLTAMHTDVGRRKKINQDSMLLLEAETDRGNILFAAVCDGMGGLSKGETASAAMIRRQGARTRHRFTITERGTRGPGSHLYGACPQGPPPPLPLKTAKLIGRGSMETYTESQNS